MSINKITNYLFPRSKVNKIINEVNKLIELEKRLLKYESNIDKALFNAQYDIIKDNYKKLTILYDNLNIDVINKNKYFNLKGTKTRFIEMNKSKFENVKNENSYFDVHPIGEYDVNDAIINIKMRELYESLLGGCSKEYLIELKRELWTMILSKVDITNKKRK